MTQEHPEKLGSLQSCSGGPCCWHPQKIHVRTWPRIPVSPAPHCCKYQCSPFWHTLPVFLIWPRLAYCFSIFVSELRVGKGRGCIWFQWNNGIDFRTAGKQRTSPVWVQDLLYLLKILLGLWAVGENFQIATAYIRNCPPVPCLLCSLTRSPSLLLVPCQDSAAQAFKLSTVHGPLPSLHAAA